jgi:hypothetical protein
MKDEILNTFKQQLNSGNLTTAE